MLKRFTVTNFKNFENTVTFSLDSASNYEFNTEVVRGGCIAKGIVFGINGSGKSNLALAIFDIILHLTDKQRSLDKYDNYLNLNSKKPTADFEYCFNFDGVEVVYRYSKTAPLVLTYESLLINGKEVLNYDYSLKQGYTSLEGAQNLQLDSAFTDEAETLSRVKYVKSNALLKETEENKAFRAFTSFVDKMLMFYSLDQNRYQGMLIGRIRCSQGIINEGKIKEFEAFLKTQGLDYNLVVVDDPVSGSKAIHCRFGNGTVPFASVASTGTRSLVIFYYWYLVMNKASFVYIDEYDAFYHFELSQEIVRLVRSLKDTQVFLSSHNTDLISNELLRPDAYFRIADNKIRSFDQLTDKELRRAHNLQKMYKAGSFNE